MSSEIVPQQQGAVADFVMRPDLFGKPKLSRELKRRALREIDAAVITQLKIDRAKHTAISGMLAENQARNLADALCGDSAEARIAADDYIRAIHASAVNQVLEAGR